MMIEAAFRSHVGQDTERTNLDREEVLLTIRNGNFMY